VLPIASAGIAYVPAIVFVGIAAIVPDERVRDTLLPTYGDYYGYVTAAIIVFAALVAPESLCPDRRSGMLGLYLASPLTRDTYLLAKALAVGGLLAVTTIGPPLLLLVANTLQGLGPDGPGDLLLVLVRVLAAGTVLAAFFTGLTLVASSFTDRRAVASAAIILLIFVTGAVTAVLVEELDAPGDLLALNFSGAPFELAVRIFGETGEVPECSTWALAAGVPGLTVLFGAITWWRYHRLAVTK
jgi:ABC-2 type transport system permease protein